MSSLVEKVAKLPSIAGVLGSSALGGLTGAGIGQLQGVPGAKEYIPREGKEGAKWGALAGAVAGLLGRPHLALPGGVIAGLAAPKLAESELPATTDEGETNVSLVEKYRRAQQAKAAACASSSTNEKKKEEEKKKEALDRSTRWEDLNPVEKQARLTIAARRGAALAAEAVIDPDLYKLAQQPLPMQRMPGPPHPDMYQERAIIPPNPAMRVSDIAKGVAVAMAAGAGARAVGNLMSRAVDRAYLSLTEGRDKAKAFAKMVNASPQLAKENSTKVQRAFNSLYRWNREAARDPLVAVSYVQRAMDYGAVTTEEVQRLVKARKEMADAREQESLLAGGKGMFKPFDPKDMASARDMSNVYQDLI